MVRLKSVFIWNNFYLTMSVLWIPAVLFHCNIIEINENILLIVLTHTFMPT